MKKYGIYIESITEKLKVLQNAGIKIFNTIGDQLTLVNNNQYQMVTKETKKLEMHHLTQNLRENLSEVE